MAENSIDPERIKERFEFLKTFREQYLTRAYDYSKVTLPYIVSENEDTSSEQMQLDYNSVGAELVNHLANRYMQELFPAARSFFKLQLDEEEISVQEAETGKGKADQEKLLVAGERAARWEFEQKHARTSILDAIKHCIVTGNACLYYPPDKEKRVQMYAIDEYVVLFSPDGVLLELITEDKKAVLSLDPEVRAKVMSEMDIDEEEDLGTVTAKLYTHIKMNPDDPNKYDVAQSIEAVPVDGSEQSYPKDLLPWMPLVWNRTRREMWGRGLVEDHYGAFYALSILTEAVVTGGAIMTDFKFLVRPGSVLDVVEMNAAASGTYHYGDPDDVQSIETGKVNDFKFIFELINWYKQSLGKAFLSLSSQMRDAERVTAEENRLRAMELETAHGGVFSNFSLTLQAPIARLLLRDIDIDLTGSDIDPVIITGLDAMGRTADNEKMLYLFQDLTAIQNVPEEFRARMKPSDLMTIMANGRDVEGSKFIQTEEEFVQSQQALQGQQTAAMAGQEMMKKADAASIAEGLSAAQGG